MSGVRIGGHGLLAGRVGLLPILIRGQHARSADRAEPGGIDGSAMKIGMASAHSHCRAVPQSGRHRGGIMRGTLGISEAACPLRAARSSLVLALVVSAYLLGVACSDDAAPRQLSPSDTPETPADDDPNPGQTDEPPPVEEEANPPPAETTAEITAATPALRPTFGGRHFERPLDLVGLDDGRLLVADQRGAISRSISQRSAAPSRSRSRLNRVGIQ